MIACMYSEVEVEHAHPGPPIPSGLLRLRPAGLRPAAPPVEPPQARLDLSLSSADGLDSGQAKAQAAAPVPRRVPEADPPTGRTGARRTSRRRGPPGTRLGL